MNILFVKLIVGSALFAAWVFLTLYPQANDAAIVSFIQLTLGGLVQHLVSGQSVPDQIQPVIQPKSTIIPQIQKTSLPDSTNKTPIPVVQPASQTTQEI